jgi:hypothetical protein
MHATTVRFDEETWQQLKLAGARAGVSSAQYIRDATVQRMAAATHLPELIALRRDVGRLEERIAMRRLTR